MEEAFLTSTTLTWTSAADHLNHSMLLNASQGCGLMTVRHMDYLPWDNPDNIISAEVEMIVRRVKVFVLVILFLIGGPGNLINMAVFYKQGLRDRVNVCLFALAFADELYMITAMFYYAEQVHLQFTSQDTFGPLLTFLTNNHVTGLMGTAAVSVVLSAIIASERCLCVLHPLKFQTFMHSKTMTAIIIFVFVALISLYTVVTFRFAVGCVYNPISGSVMKTAVLGEFYLNHKQFIDRLDGVLFAVCIPATSLTVVMTTTIITVVKLRQIVTWRAGTTSSLSPREIALTKMLVGNSILFLVCTFPRSILRFSWLFLPEMNSGRRYHNFYLSGIWYIEITAYINASVNIIVYYSMGSRYRETCRALFLSKQRPAGSQKH